MRDSQVEAICRALAYIIKCLAPLQKSDAAKKERLAVLQGLQNARRLTQTGADDPLTGAPRESARSPRAGSAAGDDRSDPSEPAAPSVIGLTITKPDFSGEPPAVRPGTVAGSPFTRRVSDVEEE